MLFKKHRELIGLLGMLALFMAGIGTILLGLPLSAIIEATTKIQFTVPTSPPILAIAILLAFGPAWIITNGEQEIIRLSRPQLSRILDIIAAIAMVICAAVLAICFLIA